MKVHWRPRQGIANFAPPEAQSQPANRPACVPCILLQYIAQSRIGMCGYRSVPTDVPVLIMSFYRQRFMFTVVIWMLCCVFSGPWTRWNFLTYLKLTTTVSWMSFGCYIDFLRFRSPLGVLGWAGQLRRCNTWLLTCCIRPKSPRLIRSTVCLPVSTSVCMPVRPSTKSFFRFQWNLVCR